MKTTAVARSIRKRMEKMKERVIDMHYQARDAGLDRLSYELASVFTLMDEAIGEAEEKEGDE